MKKSILSFIILLICFCQVRATDVPGGNVTGTWTKAGSPYDIYGDIAVPDTQVLVIEPGVEVVFHGHYRLSVYSADLIAVGAPDKMILFTMADTNGLVAGADDEGGWNGLRFFYSSESGDTSRLEYCRFEYAKVNEEVAGGRGTIGTERIPRLLVANCVFEYNYSRITGVDCRLADVAIRNNTFRNNVGENLFQTSQANPFISGNRIEDNAIGYMIVVTGWCFPVLENNIIKNNQADYILYANGEKADPTLVNNMIINNRITSGRQTLYLKDSEAKIYGNLIANNDGGGIRIFDGNPEIVNNTITGNLNEYGLYVNTNQGVFDGNIISGNDNQVYYNKRTTEPSFVYNLIEGGISGFIGDPFTGTGHDNLEDLPLFIDAPPAGPDYDAEAADFGLLSNSPAINKGDPDLNEKNFLERDIYHNERVKYSFIDIGAAEGSVSNMNIGPVTYSSDQTLIGDTIRVNGDITIDDDVVLRIAGGSRILFEGPYLIDVNGTLLAEGTESDSIWFTLSDTTGFGGEDYNAGCWKGIDIIDGGSIDDNVPSSFEYCVFEYAKNETDGGVFTLSSIEDFSVSHSVFRFNRGGTGRAVISALNSQLDIDDCSFISNYSKDVTYASGAVYLYNTDLRISNSIFKYNWGANGICIYIYGGSLYSHHNIFRNNYPFSSYAGGGSVLYATNTECTIVNDLAVNNLSRNAGAYEFSSCFASITNSTIANNRTSNANFAGGIGLTRTELNITNSILYGNTAGPYNYSIFLFEENTDPDLYNCLIEGGAEGIRTYTGFSFTGEFSNCLDQDPHFIRPTTLSGMDEDAGGSNWQLLDISPAINGGAPDTSGLQLPATDLEGNPRILSGRVDIGAYEKSGNSPLVTNDPQGGNFCTGDEITLRVEYGNTDTVKVQWKKDGVSIPGANDLSLVISPAQISDEGNYICVLSNTYGTVTSAPVFLSVKAAPEILVEPDYSWVQPDVALNMNVQVNGSSPLVYQWKKNGQSIPGAILPEYKFIPADSSFEGAYTCSISNVCGEVTTTPVNLLLAPQICMVTVDPATGRNQIVWEKKTHASLLAYNLYRETQAAGIYDILGTVPYDDLSVFTDSTAVPTVQAYLYKITALDASGEETDADLCKPHKTIHLLVSTNPELNTTQLAWDKYYGFDYQTYNIYRSTDGVAFDSVHSIASSLISWTDPLPVAGDLYYRIAVKKPEPCIPEGGSKKAGTLPYTHSLSNLDDNKLKAGESPPDSIVLDNRSIDENGIPGMLVGRFTTFDPDSGDHHSYELASGTGDEDNASFLVIGNMLLSGLTFDYETRNSYSVRISSTDMASNVIEKAFTILINDTEEPSGGQTGENPPTGLSLDNATIDENALPGTLVGRLSTTDPDTFDVHTYQLVAGTGGDDNGSFTVYGDLLIAAASFDYETRNSYSVRIRSTDMAANSIEGSFTITVNDLEEGGGTGGTGAAPPDTILLSRTDIMENNPIGALVARLLTSDPDTFDVHTYQLVQGTGDADNGSFSILGDMLLAAEVFDFETQSTYTLRIRTTDLGGNHLDNIFVIAILDEDETVGIRVNEGQAVRIYPNPFSHSARVEFPNPDGEAYRMRLINLAGKIVMMREDIRTGQFELQRENLGKGYYLIELRGKQVYHGRIVIE